MILINANKTWTYHSYASTVQAFRLLMSPPKVWKQPWFCFAFSLQNCPFSCGPLWSSIGIILSISREMSDFFLQQMLLILQPNRVLRTTKELQEIQDLNIHSSHCIDSTTAPDQLLCKKKKTYYPAVRYLDCYDCLVWLSLTQRFGVSRKGDTRVRTCFSE